MKNVKTLFLVAVIFYGKMKLEKNENEKVEQIEKHYDIINNKTFPFPNFYEIEEWQQCVNFRQEFLHFLYKVGLEHVWQRD